MENIVLLPVGNNEAQLHYEKTIKEGIDISELIEFLDRSDLDKLCTDENHKVRIWGNASGSNGINEKKLSKLDDGDIAFFVKGKKIFALALILKKVKSPSLSDKLWKDYKWNNILFLTNVKSVDITMEDFNDMVGYKKSYILQGIAVININRCKKLIDQYDEEIKEITPKFKDKEETQSYLNTLLLGREEIFIPKIFISYSHVDEHYKDELKKHLAILNYKVKATIWDDRLLEAGSNYNIQIDKALEESNIFIMLISSDYFASEYCMYEYKKILDMPNDTKRLPVIVRDCYWKLLFGDSDAALITYPRNNRNIYASNDKDKEYKEIIEFVYNMIKGKIDM